ncbi:hypothetical protein [Oleiagrimonas sp. C23AA]|uniref:hypothetical protein n=1 Tax=Oleiagrimonas sp. C23AA TaxID=2719047 RepID=UPI00141E4C85|nr:hypothetical protein [Oleiagrimonas sp. C23AA]NII10026.1 hypothetical protein [Oleiagrimonas sp. C23AA]
MYRIVCGFVVAALWLPVVQWLVVDGYNGFWFACVAAGTLGVSVIFGVPLFLALRRHLGAGCCLLAGMGLAAVGVLVFGLATNMAAAMRWGGVFLIVGLISGALFWLVAVWHNPRVQKLARATVTPIRRARPG